MTGASLGAEARLAGRPEQPRTGLCAGVFALLLASYAFFWQARDWNCASRLMLVYALGDRGTIELNGLEKQTGDAAFDRGRYFTDKQPGYSIAALPAYVLGKFAFGLPPHPLGRAGFAHWPADYWVTLATSGLATAWTGALLTWLAMRLGCGPRRAVLVGAAYGIATPAYVYATLAYGHQLAAALLVTSVLLVAEEPLGGLPRRWRWFLAGFLASYAATIELSVGPVSALIAAGFAWMAVQRGAFGSRIAWFALGAIGPALLLLAYNQLAFGSPFDMGYSHHVIPRFRAVHSADNPLGLRAPRWDRAGILLFSTYRGLFVFAPIVLIAPVGWVKLARSGAWCLAGMTCCGAIAVFLVNLSYPEWTGGWATGPRLLVPLLPFALVGVAGALTGPRAHLSTVLAIMLAAAGAVVCMLFLGVGGRVPDEVFGEPLWNPLAEAVWPLWRGDPVPRWWIGERFGRNLVVLVWPAARDPHILPAHWQWIQFIPLWAVQAIALSWMIHVAGGVQPKDAGAVMQPKAL